jgi:serine/threonine protein kinase
MDSHDAGLMQILAEVMEARLPAAPLSRPAPPQPARAVVRVPQEAAPELAKAPAPAFELKQKIFGCFRLQRQIGAGSFASVYLAQQEGTERLAVIKVAHPHLSVGGHGALIESRFAAEFKAATRVQHPNLATVFMAGRTAEGLPAIAMEHVDGILLVDLLTQHAPCPLRSTVRILAQLASVTAAIHRAGIIHRDITPNNVMIAREPESGKLRCKLLDFGIAKLDDLNLTAGPVGTPRYVAPEQLFGAPCAASDIYSLGAILWWLLTGHEHLRHLQHMNELFQFHQRALPPVDPRQLRPHIPKELAELSMSLLDPNPNDRPSAERLSQICKQLWGGQAPSRAAQPSPMSGSVQPQASLPPQESLPPSSLPSAAALSATVLGSRSFSGSVTPTQRHNPPPPPPPSSGRLRPHAPETPIPLDVPTHPRPTSAWRRETLTRFIGDMPEWLSALSEALEYGDLPQVAALAQLIGPASENAGAHHLARLSSAVLGMAQHGMLPEALALSEEMHREYTTFFRATLHELQRAHAR